MRRRLPSRRSGAGSSAADGSTPDAGASRFFDGAPPRILAHRGFALDAPENTLLSFERAVRLGITHIETDVHVSADGVAVISHDPDLGRVAGREGRIEQLTMAELRQVDLGHGQTFASLGETLAAFPDARFNIDLKTAGVVGPAVAAILDAGATHRVLVTSFGDARRVAAVRRLPGVATSASARSFLVALAAAKLGLGGLVRLVLRDVQAVQVPERVFRIRVITARTVRLLHAASVEIHVWTINEAADMNRLLDAGIDGIVTDRSDLAIDVLIERAAAGQEAGSNL